jgi:hypothetical protein
MRSRENIAAAAEYEQAKQRDASAPASLRASGKAKRTPAEHAEHVLGKKTKRPKLLNMKGGRHKNGYHQMPDGTYMTGARHTKYSKPLKVVE